MRYCHEDRLWSGEKPAGVRKRQIGAETNEHERLEVQHMVQQAVADRKRVESKSQDKRKIDSLQEQILLPQTKTAQCQPENSTTTKSSLMKNPLL